MMIIVGYVVVMAAVFGGFALSGGYQFSDPPVLARGTRA